jgi:hypothetical protein
MMSTDDKSNKISKASAIAAVGLQSQMVQKAYAEEAMDKMIKDPPNRATRRALRRAMRKKGSKRRV